MNVRAMTKKSPRVQTSRTSWPTRIATALAVVVFLVAASTLFFSVCGLILFGFEHFLQAVFK